MILITLAYTYTWDFPRISEEKWRSFKNDSPPLFLFNPRRPPMKNGVLYCKFSLIAL